MMAASCGRQDKADDVVVGIKSTALHFGADTKPWLSAFAASTVGLLGVAGALLQQARGTLVSAFHHGPMLSCLPLREHGQVIPPTDIPFMTSQFY